jgi:alpha-mannosidase
MMYKLSLKQKLALSALYERIDSPVIKLTIRGSTSKEPIPFAQREQGDFKTYSVGDCWGELFDCAWFNLQGKIPTDSLSKELYLKLDFNCELCLFNSDGIPVKGFTNKSSDFDKSLGMPTKRYFQLNNYIASDGTVNLWIDAGFNDLFGKIQNGGKIECADVVERNILLRTLYYDLETLLPIYPREATRALKLYMKSGEIGFALEITSALLKKTTSNNHIISSIGHSHIDLAWLWPIRETKRKAARTFSNVLYLMDRYPDFKFGASQPQCYQWVKEDYPGLYEKIRERIKEGRWEVQGGMWVESDTNVPGGESLVRQMLYGIRFFQQEFGQRVKSLWLPDVFGYNGNLPQIIKKSGLDYFMTIKLSWNRTNQFPYHTFHWKGIDGTGVLAHMPPEGTYNSPINVHFAYKSQNNYREKKISNRTLNLFGIGDGGGGPGSEHLERLQRLKGLDPLPKVRQEFSSAFFDEIARDSGKYPSYQGELYLEYHRGTYTSQSRNKYYNRKLEQKLKTIETMLVHLDQYARYKGNLEKIWKEFLLYQFHDILPGSSIKRVYDESVAAYQRMDGELDAILEKALGTPLIYPPTENNNRVYNPLPRQVSTWRLMENGGINFVVLPFSDNTVALNTFKSEKTSQTDHLENSLLRITFNSDGSIGSVYDKELQQELLRGPGNVLRVYQDSGDAWNMLPHYWWLKPEKLKLVNRNSYQCGTTTILEQHYRYHNSTLVQKIMLHPDLKLVEFESTLDWQDSRKMLRTAFPLKLKTDNAICDIQFGNITRATGNKTSIEKARWEIPAQKWVDMSNGTIGAAIMTDCKYGFRVKHNTLDLNLLRATVHPGKEGDLGQRRFRYAFYVHAGDHIQGDVDWHATVFNTWFPIYGESKLPDPLLSLSEGTVQYSTIKAAEDGDATIIRLYESAGKATSCSINLKKFGECEIREVNLIEENDQILGRGPEMTLKFAPFEIKTLKIMGRH